MDKNIFEDFNNIQEEMSTINEIMEQSKISSFNMNYILLGIVLILIIFFIIVMLSSKINKNTTKLKLDENGNYTKGETEEDKKKNITFVYMNLMKQKNRKNRN